LAQAFNFIVLGCVIFSQVQFTEHHKIRLLNILWLLALFSLSHGLYHLTEAVILIKGATLSLNIIKEILFMTSAVFIYTFALRLLNLRTRKKLTYYLGAGQLLFILTPLILGYNRFYNWNLSASYFIFLPSFLAIAAGLLAYYHDMAREDLRTIKIKRYFIIAILAFGSHGLLEGLAVERTSTNLFNLFDLTSFINNINMPLELLAALTGLAVSVSIWWMVDLFNIAQEGWTRELITNMRKTQLTLNRSYKNQVTEMVEVKKDLSRTKNLANQTKKELDVSYQYQRTINHLLKISLNEMPLRDKLSNALKLLLSESNFELTPKGGIFLTKEGTGKLLKEVAYGFKEAAKKMCDEVRFGECLCGRAAATGQIVYSGGVGNKHEHQYAAINPHGHYVIPIVSSTGYQKVLGVMVLFVEDKHERSSQEEEFLISIANTIAGIIERHRADEKIKEAKIFSDAINEIDVLLNSSFELDKAIDATLKIATQTIKVEAAAILSLDEDEWRFQYSLGLPPSITASSYNRKDVRCCETAYKQGKVQVYNNMSNHNILSDKLKSKFNFQSMMCSPLIAKNEIIGILDFYNNQKSEAFNDAQIDFSKKLSASLTMAITNAKLFHQKQKIADVLQEAILKMPASIKGVSFSHLYNSATKASRVGGDIYDLFEIADGKIGLLIADVSGKGIKAAKLTSMIKDTVKAYALDRCSPAQVMAKANHMFARTDSESLFASAFFAILDTTSGRLVYCNCGHPFPLVINYCSEKKVKLLNVTAPVLGLMDEIDCQAEEIILSGEDTLFLYTDGLTEARRGSEFFGEERLIKIVNESGPQKVDHFVEEIYGRLIDFSDGELNDDLALMALSLANSEFDTGGAIGTAEKLYPQAVF